jgi:hypothetical protein
MKLSKKRSISLAAASSFALPTFPVSASDTPGTVGLPLRELGAGAAGYHQPNYPGSEVSSTIGFPFPYAIYHGDWLRIDRSLQGILYETQRIKANFSAGSTSIARTTRVIPARACPTWIQRWMSGRRSVCCSPTRLVPTASGVDWRYARPLAAGAEPQRVPTPFEQLLRVSD